MSASRPLLLLLGAVSLGLSACADDQTASPDDPAESGRAGPAPAEVSAQLAAADLADGAADKVVTKCAGCALMMNGKAEHAYEYDGYALHFCAAACKSRFAAGDVDETLLALAIPEN